MKSLREALIKKHTVYTVKNPFGLTEKDLIGELDGVPMGVVVRMLEEQSLQGNKSDIIVFQHNITSDKHAGGFDWADSRDGMDFWHGLINPVKSSPVDSTYFFKVHPEYKKYNL